MKYIFNYSKFIIEDKISEMHSPLTYFLDIPILPFTNKACVKFGMIDFWTNKEYLMPIQLGRIILREFEVFKEHVHFLRNIWDSTFLRAKLQLLYSDKTFYNQGETSSDVEFEYIRIENLEFYVNIVVPFINWGIVNSKDIDLIILFSSLLCKKDIIGDKKDLSHPYPYLSKYFLNNLTVKQYFKFESRVGRDDHAYEYTHLIFTPKAVEEYYFLKLIGKEFAEKSFSPVITIKKDDEKVDISYCSYFDNNAYSIPSREYSEEESKRYKDMLIERYEELYHSLFEKYQVLFNEFIKTLK